MDQSLILIILGMAAVTYLPRFLPMYVLTRMEIPELFIEWLRYVPVAVLAALIAPGILTVGREVSINWNNSYLIASIPAFLIAWRSRSMLLTVTVGMALVLLLQWITHV
jgi:branched-subunit amino acid transport protein